MKKIRIIHLAILTVFVGAIAFIYINKPTDKRTVSEISDVDLAFAVLGDVHENIDSFQESINDFHTINPRMDALVLNGDTVDQGIEEQYDSVKKLLIKIKTYYLKQALKI